MINARKKQSVRARNERMFKIEIPLMARVCVTAISSANGNEVAAGIFGNGKKIQAQTADGIPFTIRVL